jgi:HK97 family phage major capsid protein
MLSLATVKGLLNAFGFNLRKPVDHPWNFLRKLKEFNDCDTWTSKVEKSKEIKKSFGVEKAAMSEGSGTVGGYLVPPGYSDLLMESLAEATVIRERAIVIPMTSSFTYCPKPGAELVTASKGTTPFFGGIKWIWGEKGDTTLTETEPLFDMMMLRAYSLIGYSVISNQMLFDMGDALEQALIRLYGRSASWYEEYAFLQGQGANSFQPTGIINAPGTAYQARGGANQISVTDLSNMAKLMIPIGWTHGLWMCSPSAWQTIISLPGVFVSQSPLLTEKGSAGSLMGRPIFVTEKLPQLGTTGDLIFIDPSCYIIGDRQETLIDLSPHPLYRNNQSVIRLWRRVGGLPLLGTTVTLANSDTGSCFVVLQ